MKRDQRESAAPPEPSTERRLQPEQPSRLVPSRDLGLRPGVDIDNIEGLLDELDGPRRR